MDGYNLTDKRVLQTRLKAVGIKPERSKGQNFLICREAVEAILEILEKGPKTATELGSGPGALTQALVLSGWKVRAIEKDKGLIEVLTKSLPKSKGNRLEIVAGDIKKEDWRWNEPYVLVGNIPYNLSGLIVRKITALEPKPEAVVLMVQKEVGQKLTAETNYLNLISVAVQLWGRAELIMNVPASCFWPKPKVDSQLILMVPHDKTAALSLEVRERAIKIAREFFRFKRKQVGGVARRLYGEGVIGAMTKVGIRASSRPQEIEPRKWVELAKVWESGIND
jgi:16S rRNA (adenine1518-N6/adenine1519-N6)-dimethyltransferase